MDMNIIYIVTQNNRKFKELKKELQKHNIKLQQIPEETFEIQADTCEEVAAYSARQSAQKYNKPIVKGDFGFFLECLNGLPGVYVKEFVEKIGVSNFLKIIKEQKNRKGYFVYSLAYCEPNKEPQLFTVKYRGRLAKELKSSEKWLTDAFIPEGENITMGEMRDNGIESDFDFFGAAEKKFTNWYIKNKLK
jgi:non-canonical purine NTP pyrophosphatase (RdgB/HAM1 family)